MNDEKHINEILFTLVIIILGAIFIFSKQENTEIKKQEMNTSISLIHTTVYVEAI